MKKLFFLFFLIAIVGTTFFLVLPTASAATVPESPDTSSLTWTYSFNQQVNTMSYTAGQPYSIDLDTVLPIGDNIQYQLKIEYSVGIDGNASAWRTSYITSFYGNSSNTTDTINLPVSDFPSGSISLDPDGYVSFAFDMYLTNNAGDLSIDFNLYAGGTGYPATVGNILFTITSQQTVTVYGYYFNYQTSGITADTSFFIPVCYWKVPVGAEIIFSNATLIPQSTEWYRQMCLTPSYSYNSFTVYDSSHTYVTDVSWTVSSDFSSYFIMMLYYDGSNSVFNNFSLQRAFWDAIADAKYNSGLTTGQYSGYNQGYNEGKNVGYSQGYDAGLAEGTPTSALGGIVQGVSGMLNIPLFGDFTLGGLIAIILGLCLLFLFLKIFAGG